MKSHHNIIYLLFVPLCFFLSVRLSGQDQQFIKDVSYLAADAKSFARGTILIENGMIKAVNYQGSIPADARQINGEGKYLIPGLIDAHIHLFQSGGLYTRPDAIDLREHRSYEVERTWLRDHATDLLSRYLRCGITSVMDIGGPMTNYDIRDENRDDHQTATLYVTGPLVSTYQPEAFKIDDPPIVKVRSSEEAVALVQRQLPRKPDFIKIWYITLPGQTAESTYEIVEATIKESHRHNVRVVVHATQLNTAKLALKAGADVLVHSVDDHLVDQDFIKLLQQNDAVYIPTLIVSENYGKTFTQSLELSEEDFALTHPLPLGSLTDLKHLEDGQILRQMKDAESQYAARQTKRNDIKNQNLIKLQQANCKIATGTDAGNIGTLHASSYFSEIKRMQAAGLSNPEILYASTMGGAFAIGQQVHLGSIEVGKTADLLMLSENPIDDIMTIRQIEFLFRKGVLIDPDTLVIESPENLAQQQLNGYNARNIDAFLAPYSDDVELYNFPDERWAKGKETMRTTYAKMFENTPDLHCQLVNRLVQGNTVIDQERVTGFGDRDPIEAIAIYKIENGKIAKVYFISE